MKKSVHLLISSFICFYCIGQTSTKKVLFLGNSYTQVNNLPQLIADAALSTNDNLIFDSNTPGGYTLQGHNSNSISLSKISEGNWDFVVLQEQSQLPSFPINQVNSLVYPFAQSLNNLINSQNPCAETIFYMTWGRQNGDSQNCASNPPVCTYEGMNDLLRERYMAMTVNNAAIVSPVGAVWLYLRTNYPTLNLYSSDGSHPSIIGSYAAACSFYVAIFRKDPTLITFNSTLSVNDASIIKAAVKNIVFDNLEEWKIGNYDPTSSFTYSNSTNTLVNFFNTSNNSNQYLWDFGDSTTSADMHPVHTYSIAGQHTITLTASKCGALATSQQTINTSILSKNQNFQAINTIAIYPNPVKDKLIITSSEKIKLIEVFDVFGRLIETYKNENPSIDFSSKKSGVYFLKTHTENDFSIKKVIKE